MLHVLYTLLLSHTNPHVNKYITIAITNPDSDTAECHYNHIVRTLTHKNMARSRIPEMNWATENHEEALQLFKQTMSYYCEDKDITDPGKIALKILKGIGNEGLKRLNASGMSDADKKMRDKIWELFESQLKTNLNFRVHRLLLMDYRQRSEESVDDFVTRARTQALNCEFEKSELEERIIELMIASTPTEAFQRELLGKAKGYKLTDALAEGRRSRRSTGNSETHKHTTEQCGPSRPSMWQLWQSPFPKSMSGIQRLVQILWKNRTLEEILPKTQSNKRPKEDGNQRGATKSDGKQLRDAGKGGRRRDRRFHDLEPAASYTSEEDSTEPYDLHTHIQCTQRGFHNTGCYLP